MTEQPHATFWQRATAAFADANVFGVLAYCVVWLLSLIGEEVWSALFAPISWWLYEAWMTSSRFQATLGKLMVGIAITDTQGTRITFLRASGRHASKYVSVATIFVGFVMAGFTKRKQALHDKIASTLVEKRLAEAGWLIGKINKLWNGDIRLVVSYWIIGFLGLHIISIPIYVWYEMGLLEQSDDQYFWKIDLAIIIYLFTFLTIVLFAIVGIWRSANKYTGPQIWARLAQAMIIIGIASGIGLEFFK